MKKEIKISTQSDLKSIFDMYYKPLIGFAGNFISLQSECEDVVQEVFISLWKTNAVFNNDIALRSYLYKTVRNKCYNIIKHQKVKEKYAQEVLPLLENDFFVEEKVVEEEITRILHRAITTLPERRQQVIKLSLKGIRNNEIAELLSIKLQTVKTLKSQAYAMLRDSFKNSSFLF